MARTLCFLLLAGLGAGLGTAAGCGDDGSSAPFDGGGTGDSGPAGDGATADGRVFGDSGLRPDAGGPFDGSAPGDGSVLEDSGQVSDGGLADAAGRVPGDSCDNPIELILQDGVAMASGDTTGAMHDHDGPSLCSHCRDRIDLVYSFDVPHGTRATGHYMGEAGGVDCISLQPACPSSMPGGFSCGDPEDLTNPTDGREFPEGGKAYFFIWTESEKSFDIQINTEPL